MTNCCFRKDCAYEVQYVCVCLCCETHCCEFHLEVHLKLPNRTHNFDSILSEPCEWTKVGILEFLAKEKFKKEKLRKIALASFTQYCYKPNEESLREIDSDLEKINILFEQISQASENEKEADLISTIFNLNTGAEISNFSHRNILHAQKLIFDF